MREILFRAWDKKTKTMEKVGAIDWDSDYKIITCNREKDKLYRGHSDDTDFDIMQFIGLKDKNKKEIYEGDIVNIEWVEETDEKEKYWKSAVIVWWDSGFRISTDFVGYDLHHPILTSGETLSDIWEDESVFTIEIVGNIYENPELIEGR